VSKYVDDIRSACSMQQFMLMHVIFILIKVMMTIDVRNDYLHWTRISVVYRVRLSFPVIFTKII